MRAKLMGCLNCFVAWQMLCGPLPRLRQNTTNHLHIARRQSRGQRPPAPCKRNFLVNLDTCTVPSNIGATIIIQCVFIKQIRSQSRRVIRSLHKRHCRNSSVLCNKAILPAPDATSWLAVLLPPIRLSHQWHHQMLLMMKHATLMIIHRARPSASRWKTALERHPQSPTRAILIRNLCQKMSGKIIPVSPQIHQAISLFLHSMPDWMKKTSKTK